MTKVKFYKWFFNFSDVGVVLIISDLKFKWKGNLKSILWLFVNAVKLSHARAP